MMSTYWDELIEKLQTEFKKAKDERRAVEKQSEEVARLWDIAHQKEELARLKLIDARGKRSFAV